MTTLEMATGTVMETATEMVMEMVTAAVTAVAGGVIRDVIANKAPLVLHREIYATAAFFGGLSYLLLQAYAVPFSEWLSIGVAFLARGIGVVTGFHLPRARGGEMS